MAKIYQVKATEIDVEQVEGDARGIQLTVPNGLDHNEVVMALKRLVFEVMRGR